MKAYNTSMQSNKDIFIHWLNARKITNKVVEDFEIHWQNNRIVIPVKDDRGIHLFNKYRRNPLSDEGPKYTYDKGGQVALYALDQAKDKPIILITEGELDCLVAWSANIPAISSTGGAQSFQKSWAHLFEDKEVILCFDNDAPGGEGMVRTLKIIPHAKIIFIPDRPGIKDISDYVSNGGDLNELLKTARQFTSLDDVKEHRAERISLWLSTWFHDAYIRHQEEESIEKAPKRTKGHFSDAISRAKAYPMENLIDFSAYNACCPFHAERTASFHYYPDNNRAYCFGNCGKSYDAIDVYMKVNNVSFKEAVKQMQ